jgi:hypothetical protein
MKHLNISIHETVFSKRVRRVPAAGGALGPQEPVEQETPSAVACATAASRHPGHSVWQSVLSQSSGEHVQVWDQNQVCSDLIAAQHRDSHWMGKIQTADCW